MTKYRIEERIKAAQAVMAGESIAGAARKFGICSNIVSRDVRRIEKHGEGKDVCRWGRPTAPTCKRTSLSQQIDAKTGVTRSWERAG